MKNVRLNEKFTVKAIDFVKGAIMAVGTPILYVLQEMIPNYPLGPIEKAAISAFIAYLLKNYFSPASVITTYSSNEEATAVSADIQKSITTK